MARPKPAHIIIETTKRYVGAFGSWKEFEIVEIEDCTGLDAVNKKGQGDKSKNVVINQETPTGELIGVNINELIAGVPGVEPAKQ